MVRDTAWVRSPIDAFILAKVEATRLRPAPSADKYARLRRVTFDLTGLPPTPEEIDAFVSDGSPSAFERVVDRLLRSPAYGERWGRHWLDIARYADSNGLDENTAFGNAWRYRDYVIQSFNRDKPYDEFVNRLPATVTDVRQPRPPDRDGVLVLGRSCWPSRTTEDEDGHRRRATRSFSRRFGLRAAPRPFDPSGGLCSLLSIFTSTRTMSRPMAQAFERPLPTGEA